MAPLEKPIDDKTIGGGEKTVDRIGMALLGATVVGVTAHMGLSVLRHKDKDKDQDASE
jgi:hypothetical protein